MRSKQGKRRRDRAKERRKQTAMQANAPAEDTVTTGTDDMVEYMMMLTSMIEGRQVSREEITALLAENGRPHIDPNTDPEYLAPKEGPSPP